MDKVFLFKLISGDQHKRKLGLTQTSPKVFAYLSTSPLNIGTSSMCHQTALHTTSKLLWLLFLLLLVILDMATCFKGGWWWLVEEREKQHDTIPPLP
jgi:hypothetical protein